MGWDTYLALRRRFSETTILQQATADDRPRGRRLPLSGSTRLVAGTARRRGQDRRQPDAVAARHRLARAHAARERLRARRLHRRRRDRLRRQRRLYGHYQQDINTFARLGRRRGQGRLVRRRRGRLTPAAAYAAIHQAILRNASHRPMLLKICNFLQPGQGRPTRAWRLGVQLLLVRPVRRQQLAHRHRRRRPRQRALQSVLRNLDADATAALGRRARATGTTPTTSPPTRG